MPRFLPLLMLLGLSQLVAQDLRGPDLTDYETLVQVIQQKTLPDLIILDVRTYEEYLTGHIPGAVSFPLEKLYKNSFPSKSALTPLLVYGRPASSDAKKAVQLLQWMNYQRVFLFGSITKWEGELQ